MPFRVFIPTASWLLLLLGLGGGTEAGITMSIYGDAGYLTLRECAQEALYDFLGVDLYDSLGCEYPPVNACYCREDLAPQASSFITSFCNTNCDVGSPDADITAAVNVWNSYCRAEGYSVGPEPVEADVTADPTTAGGGGDSAAETGGTVPTTTRPSETNTGDSTTQDDSSGGGSSGLGQPAIIGIAVSVACSVLGLIFTVGFKIYQHKRAKRYNEH